MSAIPTTPTPLSIYADGFDARHVVVVDYDTPARTVAFVAARLSGTLVLDVTDPRQRDRTESDPGSQLRSGTQSL